MRGEQPKKCSMIRNIVRIRQMLKRWRKKAAESRRWVPSDVPAGHVAVSVGISRRRFVVQATQLNHPIFKSLLEEAEEEYGFGNQRGPLFIPCDELLFQHIVRFLTRSTSSSSSCRLVRLEDFQINCHKTGFTDITESRPLLSR